MACSQEDENDDTAAHTAILARTMCEVTTADGNEVSGRASESQTPPATMSRSPGEVPSRTVRTRASPQISLRFRDAECAVPFRRGEW